MEHSATLQNLQARAALQELGGISLAEADELLRAQRNRLWNRDRQMRGILTSVLPELQRVFPERFPAKD